jgi:hypothetical protein
VVLCAFVCNYRDLSGLAAGINVNLCAFVCKFLRERNGNTAAVASCGCE